MGSPSHRVLVIWGLLFFGLSLSFVIWLSIFAIHSASKVAEGWEVDAGPHGL